MKRINFKEVYKYIRDPKNKPVLFFGFYFVFFLVLAILFRISPDTDVKNTKNKVTRPEHYYNLGKIEDANYHFKYNYNINNNITSFEGDRNGIRQLFFRNSNNVIDSFYGYRNLYMIKKSDMWEKSDNPYVFPEFFQVDVIREILESATFMSKTEFQNKKYSYNYVISTSTLEKIINNNLVDLDDAVNEVVIKMDNNYYVEEIDYKIDSFAKFKNPDFATFRLDLSFSDFGNIKEIEEVN